MDKRPTLLVVGAATRDVDAADARGWRLGGTVAYASLAAARLGVRVRALIGAEATIATASEIGVLRDEGIEVRLVPLDHGPVFDNQQTPAARIQIAQQASDRMPAASLPDEWRSSGSVLLGPVANELGPEWAAVFGRDTIVALAWQGLLRELTPGERVRLLPLIRNALVQRAEVLLVSAEDVLGDRAEIAELLASNQRLLVTSGAHGAVELRRVDGRIKGRYAPALPPSEVIDETGAGDIFLATWLATRILTGMDDWRALSIASAMAGLSVARRGLADMPGRRDLCEALLKLRDRHHG